MKVHPFLSVGDVVRHRLLGREKIVVGMGEDRYLCIVREDMLQNGRLRPNARVALHRAEHLQKIGHIEIGNAVDLTNLCTKELKQVRRVGRRNIFTQEIIPYLLFLVAGALIVLAVLSIKP